MTWREFAPAPVFDRKGENRAILFSVWWNAALLVLCAAALPFDHRHILGLNPWVKPIKFQLSTVIFLLTMAVLLSAVGRTGRWRRTRSFIGWGIAVAMLVENTIISMQSLRGVRSHMNIATAFDATAFSIMGAFIAFNTVLVAMLLLLYLITRTGLPPALTWGIGLGLFFLLDGSMEGVAIVIHNAHVVGAPDGVAGLPFLNWSTAHGDLRVAHFFAIHALQIFTLAGLFLSSTRLTQNLQVATVVLFAVAYSSLVWLLFAQAMAGRPLLAHG